jgi:hypothetical protein
MKLISIAALTASVLIAGSGLIVAAKAPIDPNYWRFAGPVSADAAMAEANTTVMPALSFSLDFFQPHRITPELALGSQDVDENGGVIALLDYLAEAENRSGKPLWFTR